MADNRPQTEYLQDLILEVMQSNETLDKIDRSNLQMGNYLNDINANAYSSFEVLNHIAEIMSGNNLAALEKAKEDGAMQERMLKALDGIKDNTKEKPKAKDLSLKLGPAAILGGILAFVGGFIKGYLERFKDVAKGFFVIVKEGLRLVKAGITAAFTWAKEEFLATKLGQKVSALFESVGKRFDALKDSVAAFFKSSGESRIGKFFSGIKDSFFKQLDGWADEFKIIKEYFGPIVTKIKSLLAPILDIGARMDDVKGAFTFIKDTVKGWITGVFDKIKSVLGVLSGGDSILAKVGSFFGKFLAPVTFLMTLWDTVKGAYEGYQEGGLLGAVKGALTGFLSSLVGEPLNMLKSAVSWIAEKLGFGAVSEVLDSFDFMEFIKNSVKGIWDWFVQLFTDPGAALTTLWNNLVGEGGLIDLLFKPIDMLIDWVTKKLGWRDEDAPEFSLGNIIRGVWNTIIDWVASLVEKIPVVGGRGAEAIRGMKAGEATADLGKMGAAKVEKPSEVPQSGDALNKAASDKRNTEVAAAVMRDNAAAAPVVIQSGGAGGSGGGSVTNTVMNVSNGKLPDRTDWSVLGGGFGVAP